MDADESTPTGAERRVHKRYRVNLSAVAVRSPRHPPAGVPDRAPITVTDLSAGGIGWRSRHLFRRDELVGVQLATDRAEGDVNCVVRVVYVRAVDGQHLVGAEFVRVSTPSGSFVDRVIGAPAETA